MRRSCPLALLVLLALTGPAPVAAQADGRTERGGSAPADAPAEAACSRGTVDRIQVRNHSLFAPEDIRDHRFEWALGFANWVHVRTRPGFVLGEMLLREGSCWDPGALDESMRLIRELDFIARVEGEARLLPDSTWAVRVETWDEWSTQVGVDFDVESRFQFKGFFVREKNLLGRGHTLSFRYRKFRERDDRSLALSTERFLGTRVRASVAGGTTRTGTAFRQELRHPFVSEAGRFFLRSRLRAEDREHAYVTGSEHGVTHLLLPLRDRSWHMEVARRWGSPGDLTLLGGEVEVLRRTVSGSARSVLDRDFEAAFAAPDSLADRLASETSPPSHVRAGVRVGLRRFRFSTGRGLDLVSGVQDVATGGEIYLTLGRSVHTWSTSPHFGYGRLEGFLGGAAGPVTANADVIAEARVLDGTPAEGGSRWRDLRLTGRALLYLRPPALEGHTVHGGLRFDLRDRVDQPYQRTLGGETGVRSYRDDQVPTGSTLVGFLEHRVNVGWLAPAVDLGFTVFGDVGRGWAGDTPFGVDTGWRASAGGGIRVGFPAGTGSVTHLELAWPVHGPDVGRSPVFRTYFTPLQTSR